MSKSSIYDFDKSTVTSRLIRWGAWKLGSSVACGYPSVAAFMRMAPCPMNINYIDEIDSECVQTNAAYETISEYQYKLVIHVEYYAGIGLKRNDRARLSGYGKSQYYLYLDRAHQEIARKLNLLLCRPDKTDINVLNVS